MCCFYNLYMVVEQRVIETFPFFITSFLQTLQSSGPWEKNDIAFNGAEHVWNHQVQNQLTRKLIMP